ncbi:MAG: Ig-like domain-containing protein [Planctomycetales bacterium]|nr:Ig-like domain-containing protein [Planctomycetales bacterium]
MTRRMLNLGALATLCAAGAVGCDKDDENDFQDLYIVSVNPVDSQTNVPIGTQIVLRFSVPVDPSSYSPMSAQIIMVDQTNSSVPISIRPTAAEPASEFVIITPATPLQPNVTYGVAVREFVRAAGDGERIVAPFAAEFSTGPVLSTIPGWPPFLTPNPAPPNAGPSGTFSLTSQLNTRRARHSAVALQSGDVAIFGGTTPIVARNGGTVLRSAEVYKRVQGLWVASGSNNGQGMFYPRYGHTATLLTNGKILVAGGGDERTVWDTAELYDPLSDTFSPTPGRMAESRQYHTANLIGNGNVVLAGGWSMSVLLGNALGATANTALITNSIEVFDVTAGTFTRSTQRMNMDRCYHTGTVLADGRLMVAGGYRVPWFGGNWCPTTSTADVYSPEAGSAGAQGTLFATGSMKVTRMTHTATIFASGNAAGLVLIVGGYTSTPFYALLQNAEIYDPNIDIGGGLKGSFELVAANMAVGRRAHTASLLQGGPNSGKVLLVGGSMSQPQFQSYFDPPPHVWPSTEGAPCALPAAPPVPVPGPWPVSIQQACIGTRTAELFDPFGFGYQLTAPYRGVDQTGRFDWTRNAAGNQTIMVGTSPVIGLSRPGRYYHTATPLPSGHILIAGGWDCPFCAFVGTWSGPETALQTCELYNP